MRCLLLLNLQARTLHTTKVFCPPPPCPTRNPQMDNSNPAANNAAASSEPAGKKLTARQIKTLQRALAAVAVYKAEELAPATTKGKKRVNIGDTTCEQYKRLCAEYKISLPPRLSYNKRGMVEWCNDKAKRLLDYGSLVLEHHKPGPHDHIPEFELARALDTVVDRELGTRTACHGPTAEMHPCDGGSCCHAAARPPLQEYATLAGRSPMACMHPLAARRRPRTQCCMKQ